MITNRTTYAQWCEAEQTNDLRRMSIDESIALGEALLTSELMDHVTASDHTPRSLAIALGITAPRISRTREPAS